MSLEALIHPISKADFFSADWTRLPVVAHDLEPTVRELRSLPLLASLDSLLNSWPSTVQVHLPDARDESSAIDARPGDAKKLFANKMGLLFNNAQLVSPVLQDWLSALKQDLGLPTSTHARCMIYATPDGQGTAPHFDQNINFVLQLHGTKKWYLAPNGTVENPTERHVLGQPVGPELASYMEAEMPDGMPADAREIILKPGSMLFVPRGFWHRTEASGEALALNFTFSQPTWIDIFTLALRSRLSLSPAWRSLADGVTSANAQVRMTARHELDYLLAELVEDLPNWRAEDILGATEGEFDP